MSTTMGFLIAIAAVTIVVYVVRLRLRARGNAERSHSRKRFVEREKERDRLACRAAALSMDSQSAPNGAFSLADAEAAPASPDGRRPPGPADRRRRSSGSTAFDPDLPGA